MMTSSRIHQVQVSVCLLLGLAALYFFVTNISKYYFIGDDAYISFIYARHLVEGNGLVWNPGEIVEGYTNFLWVVLMAGSIYLGISPEISSNVLSIGCSALLLLSFIYMFAQVHGLRSPWTWLPVLVFSLSRSYTAWSTSGLETMLFTLLLFWAFMAFLRERENSSPYPFISSSIFALATLTRPDGGVFMLVAGLFFLFDIVSKRRTFRSGLIWALPYIAVVGAHFLWRYSYYGFWLPNTFYAKVAGLWLEQGLNYLQLFTTNYRIYWFLPFALVTVVTRRNFTSSLLLAVLVTFVSYILYVGGDIFEFRFLVVIFPYLYWLIVDGMALVFTAAVRGYPAPQLFRAVAVLAAAALLWTTHHGSVNPVAKQYRHGIATLAGIERYAEGRAEQGKFIRERIDEGSLPDNFIIGVGGAGALPYYARLPTVDRRGLNDVKIARMPVARRGRIAHEHDAPYEYLVERKVAVFDLYNQLIFPNKEKLFETERHNFHGREVRVRAIELKGRYMVFATFVSDEELQDIFTGLTILKPG
jgi:arabinofuranosyltransferase